MSFVTAFDLSVKLANEHHPKRSQQAYEDIARTLARFGFERVQGSVYASDHEELDPLFEAIAALQALGWFGRSVKNVRTFRMEQGADFTRLMR
jgi:virulence-associated protein VapD